MSHANSLLQVVLSESWINPCVLRDLLITSETNMNTHTRNHPSLISADRETKFTDRNLPLGNEKKKPLEAKPELPLYFSAQYLHKPLGSSITFLEALFDPSFNWQPKQWWRRTKTVGPLVRTRSRRAEARRPARSRRMPETAAGVGATSAPSQPFGALRRMTEPSM